MYEKEQFVDGLVYLSAHSEFPLQISSVYLFVSMNTEFWLPEQTFIKPTSKAKNVWGIM